jgi:predicted RNA binding protein YcfA (HicA-like mRNA interferase family)
MVHHVSQKIIPVPAHGNKDVGMGLLRKIVRDAGVSVDEWQKI